MKNLAMLISESFDNLEFVEKAMKIGQRAVGVYELGVFMAVLPLIPLLWYTYNPATQLGMLKLSLDKLQITIPIYLKFADAGFKFPDLVEASQIQLDKVLEGSRFRYELVGRLDQPKIQHDEKHDGDVDDDAESAGNEEDQLKDKYVLELEIAEENWVIVHPRLPRATLFYSLSAIHANDLPFYVTQAIVDHLVYPDLIEYNISDYNTRVEFELIQVTNSSILETTTHIMSQQLPRLCEEYLTSFSNNFVDFHIHYSNTTKDKVNYGENRFYFEVVDKLEQPSKFEPLSSIYQVTIEDSLNLSSQTVLNDMPLFSEIHYGLQDKLRLATQPSSNVNLRMGSILKHLVVNNLYQLVEIGIKEKKRLKDILTNVRKVLEQIDNERIDWRDLLDYTNNLIIDNNT